MRTSLPPSFFWCLFSFNLLIFQLTHTIPTIQNRRKFRAINSLIKEGSDGVKKNVIIVKAEAGMDEVEHGDGTQRVGDSSSSSSSNEENELQGEHQNQRILPVALPDSEQQRPDDAISIINSAFSNRKSFSCPKIKMDVLTGTSTSNLSPEDIGIIAAMGDSLATGAGLWPKADIEFRGAAFPIGGDATIDGLVTIPNILREFVDPNPLYGVSHGMGQRDQLPENQLNVAVSGSGSSHMPEQAIKLIRRMKRVEELDLYNTWALVIIAIGTEEICHNCSGPNIKALIEAVDILNSGIPKALIIFLGPIHVTSLYEQDANLLKTRCLCSNDKNEQFLEDLSEKWIKGFEEVQAHAEHIKRKTFNVMTLPKLTVTSRYPYSLFLPSKPLLNRRGHTYAAKWLWNRLIAGPKYNLSNALLSQDAYFCPSLRCPYFRITENLNQCSIVTHEDARREQILQENDRLGKNKFGSKLADIYFATMIIVGIAASSVLCLGTIFYRRSKKGSKGRFDVLSRDPQTDSRKDSEKPTNDSSIDEEQLTLDLLDKGRIIQSSQEKAKEESPLQEACSFD